MTESIKYLNTRLFAEQSRLDRVSIIFISSIYVSSFQFQLECGPGRRSCPKMVLTYSYGTARPGKGEKDLGIVYVDSWCSGEFLLLQLQLQYIYCNYNKYIITINIYERKNNISILQGALVHACFV